jgi:hypothetical protein
MLPPLKITLYDPDTSESRAEYTRGFVAWKHLKAATRLLGVLTREGTIDPALPAEIAEVVAGALGGVSVQDLTAGATPEEMITVLMQIIGRAKALSPRADEPPADASPPPQPSDAHSPSHLDWMIDIEIQLARVLGWSLRDIDETDIESLLPFWFRLTAPTPTPAQSQPATNLAYIDQVSWL